MHTEVLTRAEQMVKLHGEVTNVAGAAKILSVGRNTITKLLNEGRLRRVCDGKKVDVRSIAAYIETAPDME